MIDRDNDKQSISCGVDLVEYKTLSRLIEVGGDSFLKRIYTAQELIYCAGSIPRLATRFAAKEAVAKTLGLGIRGVDWLEIQIGNEQGGKPILTLTDRAAAVSASLHFESWCVSLSHTENYAVAMVVALIRDSTGIDNSETFTHREF